MGSLAGALGFLGAIAQAETPAFDSVGCDEQQLSEVWRIMDIELDRSDAASRKRARQARVDCSDRSRVFISVGQRSQTLDLSRVDPRIEARVLALTIVELSEFPKLKAAEPDASPTPLPPALALAKRLELWGELGNRTWFRSPYATLGLGVHGRFVDASLVVTAGAFLERGHSELDLGQVRASSGSANATVGWRALRSATELSFFTGVRIGYVDLVAEAHRPSETRAGELGALWGGPLLGTLGALRVTERFSLGLRLETGWSAVAPEATSNGQPEQLWSGAWLGASLTLGYTPGASEGSSSGHFPETLE